MSRNGSIATGNFTECRIQALDKVTHASQHVLMGCTSTNPAERSIGMLTCTSFAWYMTEVTGGKVMQVSTDWCAGCNSC